jgi:hypothetical protein
MKTITEFSGFQILDAQKKKAQWTTEGKTEEEVQTQLAADFKWDEPKVAFYKHAETFAAAQSNQNKRVKRIIVATVAEGEKALDGFQEAEGHYYKIEWFPSAARDERPQQATGRDRNGKKGGRRDGKGGDRSGGRPDRGGDRPARTPRNNDRAADGGAATSDGPKKMITAGVGRPPLPKAPREPRAPRAPRTTQAHSGPKGATELRLVLKGQVTQELPTAAASES